MPAWERICDRVKAIISWAMSVSRIRLSLAVRFSAVTFRLLIVCSNRFCRAPRLARLVLTAWIAVSIASIAEVAPDLLDRSTPDRPRSAAEKPPVPVALLAVSDLVPARPVPVIVIAEAVTPESFMLISSSPSVFTLALKTEAKAASSLSCPAMSVTLVLAVNVPVVIETPPAERVAVAAVVLAATVSKVAFTPDGAVEVTLTPIVSPEA